MFGFFRNDKLEKLEKDFVSLKDEFYKFKFDTLEEKFMDKLSKYFLSASSPTNGRKESPKQTKKKVGRPKKVKNEQG